MNTPLGDQPGGPVLVGNAPAFGKLLERVNLLAATDATVLIEGETGTGKELVAEAIHRHSARRSLPFVAINCGGIPDSLIEDELFGHVRGAFTDAQRDHSGLLASADGGTLCLDEVGSLTPRGQSALLRVLQERRFRTIGSVSEQRITARFIALTNTPLSELVRQGHFRADLYYRLYVLSITMPPLRERQADILPLAYYFLAKYARAEHPVTSIAAPAEDLLTAYEWPGNVRQLEHAMMRAAHLAPTTTAQVSDLGLPECSSPQQHEELSFSALKRQTIESFERRYLKRLMEQCAGNISQAARVARKDRRDLGKLLKKYRIERDQSPGE